MNVESDTTAPAMNNGGVGQYPEEDEEIAAYDKIKHLPYLRACLDESLRLLPPSTFGLSRRTPPEGAPVAGDFFAGNTSVSMSSYVAHRVKTIFPDPEQYKPERWLGQAGKELQPYFIALSAGARG
ncbi:uncharacterized protein Z520_06757 [Fonsecaea multimorphosa CBS 102226]|uniref:Uncharacterized protein n=1 Tax=Fonsecaea multimorphosa CBS 102226 TaxID=1442371 RepID=A0A0D2H631_9EURO|nr:uncharacterized protein Z520_06757 [Fonsecaea multimorphosa CBS 102226]KIX97305.1 hypothetical protein Z520_06757 [Fonsecaea multimorphosa CBS 102226]